MSNLAEFETAPSGTQYHISSDAQWQTASVGTTLDEGYESRNTQGNKYQVRLNADACVDYTSTTEVTLSNMTGVLKVKDPVQGWIEVSDEGDYTVNAVGTGANSGISVICSGSGAFRPRPWS